MCPKCPTCGNEKGEVISSRVGRYFCPVCLTVYDGSQDEWIRNGDRRLRYLNAQVHTRVHTPAA